jgi:hypothetical protein
MANRKVKSFQNAWLEKYVIRITARCPMNSEVLSVVCQFVTPLVQRITITQIESGKGHPMYVILRNHGKAIL